MEEFDVPESHPRYESLRTRHLIEAGVERGLTSPAGLIAHGRGEAFDYLLAEETIPSANEAERVAAAHFLRAQRPVISVNGNAAALVPGELVELAEVTGATLEVNLFNRTEERVRTIADHLREHGAHDVLGESPDAEIPGLDHERAKVAAEGIHVADVVLVPLEDGDRAAALAEMGKVEVVIDLNPLSRSATVADVPIIDNIIRAVPNVTDHARDLRDADQEKVERLIEGFDAAATRRSAESRLRSGTLE
jgi:4-phosphopantoate--beta-alanine ligase